MKVLDLNVIKCVLKYCSCEFGSTAAHTHTHTHIKYIAATQTQTFHMQVSETAWK